MFKIYIVVSFFFFFFFFGGGEGRCVGGRWGGCVCVCVGGGGVAGLLCESHRAFISVLPLIHRGIHFYLFFHFFFKMSFCFFYRS